MVRRRRLYTSLRPIRAISSRGSSRGSPCQCHCHGMRHGHPRRLPREEIACVGRKAVRVRRVGVRVDAVECQLYRTRAQSSWWVVETRQNAWLTENVSPQRASDLSCLLTYTPYSSDSWMVHTQDHATTDIARDRRAKCQ